MSYSDAVVGPVRSFCGNFESRLCVCMQETACPTDPRPMGQRSAEGATCS